MSHMVRTAKKARAMVFIPGKGAFSGAVDVYRDGAKVVVVGDGTTVHPSPHGPIAMSGRFAVKFPSVQAFDWAKRKAFERAPEKYAQLVGVLGIDDDASTAPPLPAVLFDGGDAAQLPALLPAVTGALSTDEAPAWIEESLIDASRIDQTDARGVRVRTAAPDLLPTPHRVADLLVGG